MISAFQIMRFKPKINEWIAKIVFPKRWHKGAARAAQNWADQCLMLTHDNATGRYDENFGACGQNIFISTMQVAWYDSHKNTVFPNRKLISRHAEWFRRLFAIKTWNSERHNFTYGSMENDLHVVGHYTQMVWSTSHRVGCGFAKCKTPPRLGSKTYYSYVCNYCPMWVFVWKRMKSFWHVYFRCQNLIYFIFSAKLIKVHYFSPSFNPVIKYIDNWFSVETTWKSWELHTPGDVRAAPVPTRVTPSGCAPTRVRAQTCGSIAANWSQSGAVGCATTGPKTESSAESTAKPPAAAPIKYFDSFSRYY
jgi:Cysteine-rich secretory protein family